MMKRKVILCVCVAAAALFAIGSLVVRGTAKAPFYDKGAFALSKYQEEIEASPSDRNVGQIDDAETAVAKAKELWLEKYSTVYGQPYDPLNQGAICVAYDEKAACYHVYCDLPSDTDGVAPNALIKKDGKVSAVWMG